MGEGDTLNQVTSWSRWFPLGARFDTMSFCQDFGKDKVIFVTKQDHEKPSTVALPDIGDGEPRGIVLPNGEINWNCPCLGGTASGPCAYEFRTAFTCFHESKSEIKGSECMEQFSTMQECMSQYPTLYEKRSEDKEDQENGRGEVGGREKEDSIDQQLTKLKEESTSDDSLSTSQIED